MKKDRNSFFEQSSYNSGYFPNQNMFNPNMPTMASGASQNFYSGPAIPNYNNDVDSRIAKLERQLNRLEARVNKLENNSNIDTNYDNNSNMYMI